MADIHSSVPITCIGVRRFRILGGGGGEGGKGGQIPSRHMASTSFRRHVPTRFLINQCQIITFLILKSDFIENSRIELRGIVLFCQHLQIILKLHKFYYFFTLQLGTFVIFSCFT